MIESLFIMLVAIAFLLFILGIEKGNDGSIYTGVSLILWIMLMAQSFYIEVPLDTSYNEAGFRAFCFAFILLNLIRVVMLLFPGFFERFKGGWRG